MQAFHKEWDAKHEECKAECARSIANFEEIADGRRKALELAIKRTPIKKVVRSSDRLLSHTHQSSVNPQARAGSLPVDILCLPPLLLPRAQVYSAEIRDLLIMEAKCAQGGQYEMAKRYNLSIDKQARPSSGAAAPQRRNAAAPHPPQQPARAAL